MVSSGQSLPISVYSQVVRFINVAISFPSKPRLEVNICILTISFRQQLMAFSTIHAWLHSRSWDMASTIHEPTKPDVDPTGEQDNST